MDSILQFNTANPTIGLLSRHSKTGPEQELVRDFTARFASSFKKHDTNLAIFHEPQLETGFPDLVFVEYTSHVFDDWTKTRSTLQAVDLKLLHYLNSSKGADSEIIEKQLGLNGKVQLRSLEKLLDGKLITRKSRQWQPLELKRTFAIKKLIAVEAKISNWQEAFRQAQTDKWFASESYVLSPVIQPTERIRDTARDLGVGIYTYKAQKVTEIHRSHVTPLPACHASWLFNEWIGRYLQLVN